MSAVRQLALTLILIGIAAAFAVAGLAALIAGCIGIASIP